jgi:protocatechuate 3,4-dioxygenase beta subunit
MKMALVAITLALAYARELPAVPQQVSGSLEGYVVRLGTSQPLARARVILDRIETTSDVTLAAVTDAGGKFAFRNVPPGRYRLTAERDGYLRAEYGQRNLRSPGIPLTVAPGQEYPGILLSLTPGGAMTGRVFDRFGEPLNKAVVQAFKYSYQEGRRVLTAVQTATTNDLGEYRLYWLPPQQYVIAATLPESRTSGEPVVIWTGDKPTASAEQLGAYVPVYYPGAVDPTAASTIEVQAGAELRGIDLVLEDTRAVRIRGRVLAAQTGKPVDASISLEGRGPVVRGAPARTSTSDGFFEFSNVLPGSYEIVATSGSGESTTGGYMAVEVGNADVQNIALTLTNGFRITGRIFVDGAPASARSDSAVANLFVRLESSSSQRSMSITTGADGTFHIDNVKPGQYRLMVAGLSRNFYVADASLGGLDFWSVPLVIEREPRGSLDIRIRSGSTSLDAIVLDEKQLPASGFLVLLAPDATRRGRFDLYLTGTSDESGRVHFDRLPPGEYRAVCMAGGCGERRLARPIIPEPL